MRKRSLRKTSYGWCASFGIAVVLALPYVAMAQSVPPRVLPPAEQRERNRDDSEAQNRAQERERALRQQQEKIPDERRPAASPPPAARLPIEAPCFSVHQVGLQVIAGDPSPVADWDWALKSLDGPGHDDSPLRRCLGTDGIKLLTQRMQDAVVARGFTTTAVLLAQQDLKASQALTFTIIPGRVHAIRFAEPASPRGNAWNAMPLKPGDVLNLRDLEQAIENFRRVPSAQAEIVVEPVQGAPGRSDLVIRYQQPRPFRLSLSADDSGTKTTGKYQGSMTFSYDNWWTLNDLFYVTVNHDLGGGAAGERGTRGGVVHYSVPYGYWLLGVTASRSNYHQNVVGPSQTYTYSGTSDTAEIKLSRLVYRDASRKTTLSLKGWQRKSKNFIDDYELEPQRRATGGWAFDIGHKEFILEAVLEGNLAYKRGTGAFGSLTAPEEQYNEGTSRFALVTADASLTLPFRIADQKLNYTGTWHWQINRTPGATSPTRVT
ncbi:ShlB/FhaC/HecB family hemolysin secretion/activation protein [Polaromonas sp. LjRoot131]|uniref:ShlB/FhaC/HecB family hemolysin secretion/activation protein n=1 Tax=Polaromonas sp. LjRoot131 TaxID=3342262 RepID=UPI003ED11DEF